ncbi:MAG: NAD-dependent epimerase/dehydratase family protein, partial [Mesorhizobium sp.]
MPILVTGAAGFIGSHVCHHLLSRGEAVVGVDNMNDYYDLALKEGRLARLQPHKNFSFHEIEIAEQGALATALAGQRIVRIV